MPEKVFEVEKQLLETGPGDVYQAQLCLAGGRRRPAAFRNVLPSAAGCLDHLVNGSRVFGYKLFAKPYGPVVDQRRDLE